MENKNLKIAVGVLALLLVALLGYIIGHHSSANAAKAHIQEIATATAAETAASVQETVTSAQEAAAPAQTKEEKTYGYYPSFYVKRIYYTVDAADDHYTIRVYSNDETTIRKAYTNCSWLEEERIERGGDVFHVKKNRDNVSRKGELYLIDNKGRKITIYVTQRGK